MIRVEKVSLKHGSTRILHDISLEIPKGGITALIGPNGAGKSSLLSLIARLQPLQTGKISVEGFPVDTTPNRDLAKIIAILRQDSIVTSRLRVRELVGFGRFPHGRGRLTEEDQRIIDQSLQQFDLTDLAGRFDGLSKLPGHDSRAFIIINERLPRREILVQVSGLQLNFGYRLCNAEMVLARHHRGHQRLMEAETPVAVVHRHGKDCKDALNIGVRLVGDGHQQEAVVVIWVLVEHDLLEG